MNRKPRIEVAQIDPEPLLKLKEIFGGSVITLAPRANRRQAFRWDLTGVAVAPALNAMLPFLTVKRVQAELLLEYVQAMRPHGSRARLQPHEILAREAIYHRMSEARAKTFTLKTTRESATGELIGL